MAGNHGGITGSTLSMKARRMGIIGLLGAGLAMAADPSPKASPPAETTTDELYDLGRNLFEQFAPPEVKEEYEFPDKAQWDAFFLHLQAALAGDSMEELARYEPEARAMLTTLRQFSGGDDYADWLEERLDYIEAAQQTVVLPPPAPTDKKPGQTIPHYELWRQRLQNRSRPAGAEIYVPLLQPVMAAGGVPGSLVWLAEVESTFKPNARSPAGACGLFQLMPATAKELGLSTFLPDERTDPKKSAAAAARLLNRLHAKFGDWPLALAAYNAGAGRVQRALERNKARTFAEIAPILSVETRMYVPKVLATLEMRAGTALVTAR